MNRLKYILTVLLLFTCFETFSAKLDDSYVMDKMEDTLSKSITIYLIKNNVKVDSINISNTDFYISELKKLGNYFWIYRYSIDKANKNSNNGQIFKFIIFTILNENIHISLISDFLSSSLPLSKSYYTFKHEYCINEQTFIEKPTINRSTYRKDYYTDSVFVENFNYSYPLLFDEKEKVFYSELVQSKGIYKFLGEDKKINLGNGFLKILDLGNRRYIYYKGEWYMITDHGHLIDIMKRFNISRN